MTVEYRVDDALEVLGDEPNRSAKFVHLDDAWARPKRNGAFGVEYPTHAFSEADHHYDDLESDLTVVAIVEECLRVTAPNGLLVIDTDDWLLSRLVPCLADRIGPDRYTIGHVTALTKDGDPDCSTPGMYFSTGGYTVVGVQPDACPRFDLSVPCQRQREHYEWGTAKPLAPYLDWIDEHTDPGDRIIVPCAGTAPAAIAAERLHGDDADVLCIDVEEGAKEAYERRRRDELDYQEQLGEWSPQC